MATEPESDTVTAESLAVQIIQENPDTVKKYVSGDTAALGELQGKAVALAKGRIDERELEGTLQRKLGDSY